MIKSGQSNYIPVEDDDPTEELEILPARMFAPEADGDVSTQKPEGETLHPANQPFKDEDLEAELREANVKIADLSSEFTSCSEEMKSMQFELDRLKEFAGFLEREVESGKGVIVEVTDELISVRSEQNDVTERLKRREREIDVLEGKLAKKEAFIKEFAKKVDTADQGSSIRRQALKKTENLPRRKINGSTDRDACGAYQSNHNRLRMLAADCDGEPVRYPIMSGKLTLGTSPESDVQLDNRFVSYRHAEITEGASGCVLKDLGSSNGTWVNQRRIQWHALRDGDLIDFGPLRFKFIDRPLAITEIEPEEESVEDPHGS